MDRRLGGLAPSSRPALARQKAPSAFVLLPSDLLRKLRVRRPGRLILFVVDLSGSMGGALSALAKSLATRMLRQCYLRREQVALIAFRERSAEVVLPATNHPDLLERAFRGLPLGGTTPIACALALSAKLLRQARRRDQRQPQALILISDGRANVGSRPGHESVVAELEERARELGRVGQLVRLFVDTTEAGQSGHRARLLAAQLDATRLELARISAEGRDPLRRIERALGR